MKSRKAGRPSPALVLAALALVFAMVGTAIAGPDAISSKITKSKVKKISTKQANKVLDQREGSLDVKNSDQLGGKLASDYVAAADLVARSAFDGDCDPGAVTFTDCASLTIELARESRLLINSETPFGADSPATGADGTCRIQLDGATLPETTVSLGVQVGEISDLDNTGGGVANVTAPVAAGAHTLTQQCNQVTGDIDFNDLSLSALAVGSG